MRVNLISGNDNSRRKLPESWVKLSPTAIIEPRLRKGDFDKFHFGLLQLAEAVTHLQGGQLAAIEGEMTVAKRYNDLAAREVASALRLLQDFYAAFAERSLYATPDSAAAPRRRSRKEP